MGTVSGHEYSEKIGQAADSYDQLQAVLGKLRDLENDLKRAMEERQDEENPVRLAELKEEIARLGQQIMFFDGEKERLSGEVKRLMSEHLKGRDMMSETKPKYIM